MFILEHVCLSQRLKDFCFSSFTELCQTSNFIGQTVASFDQHHFKYWFDKGHHCVICVSITIFADMGGFLLEGEGRWMGEGREGKDAK